MSSFHKIVFSKQNLGSIYNSIKNEIENIPDFLKIYNKICSTTYDSREDLVKKKDLNSLNNAIYTNTMIFINKYKNSLDNNSVTSNLSNQTENQEVRDILNTLYPDETKKTEVKETEVKETEVKEKEVKEVQLFKEIEFLFPMNKDIPFDYPNINSITIQSIICNNEILDGNYYLLTSPELNNIYNESGLLSSICYFKDFSFLPMNIQLNENKSFNTIKFCIKELNEEISNNTDIFIHLKIKQV